MSSAEFAEWVAYSWVEPFGQSRVDDGARLLASLAFNSARGESQQALAPADFLKVWEPEPEPASEDETTVASPGLIAMLERMAARDAVERN